MSNILRFLLTLLMAAACSCPLLAHPEEEIQPDSVTQPRVATQPDTVPQSHVATQPDTVPQSRVATQPDTATQPRIKQKISKLKVEAYELLEKVVGMPDSIQMKQPDADNDWRVRLRNHTLSIWDESIKWPKFTNFCLNVYRWVYNNFNRHDTTYVSKNRYLGKILIESDNWGDTYLVRPGGDPLIRIESTLYNNIGARVKYGILSIGYSFDINALAKGEKNKHYKLSIGANLARLSLEANYWRSKGPNYITEFGEYGKDDDKKVRFAFDGLDFSAWNLHALYIFNFKKYAFNAVYSFDNCQKVTMGSFIAGLDISGYNATFDFSKIPDELQNFHEFPLKFYRFSYRTYTLTGGYSVNWVMNKHFLFNITAIPGVGVTRSRENSSLGVDALWALNFRAMGGLLYTTKRFFAGASALATGNFFMSGKVDFLNIIQNYQLSLGLKF